MRSLGDLRMKKKNNSLEKCVSDALNRILSSVQPKKISKRKPHLVDLFDVLYRDRSRRARGRNRMSEQRLGEGRLAKDCTHAEVIDGRCAACGFTFNATGEAREQEAPPARDSDE
jgi:hypothetical protein